jgi:hypothetical protein
MYVLRGTGAMAPTLFVGDPIKAFFETDCKAPRKPSPCAFELPETEVGKHKPL